METAAKPRKKRWPKVLASFFIGILLFVFGLPIYFATMRTMNNPRYIQEFTKQQALEDYDDMWRLLETDFPSLQEAAAFAKIFPAEMKEKYRQEIENLPEYSVFDSFYRILERCIREFQGKGHLSLIGKRFYREMTQSVGTDPQLKYTYDFAFHELWNPKVETTYRYLNYQEFRSWLNDEALKVLLPIIKLVSGNSPFSNLQIKPISTISKTKIENDNVAYLGFMSFFTRQKKWDKPELEAFFEKNYEKKYWIWDIRYCGGGDDTYWMDLLVAPNLKQDTETPTKYTLFRDTPKTRSFFEKYPEIFSKGSSTNLSAVLNLPAINKASLATLNYLQRAEGVCIKATNLSKAFPGKIILLIDYWSGSANDGFASFCKETGFATLVGKQTMGNSGGLNPIVHRLPNSGLALYYQMDYTLNPDGSLNSIMGTKPDIESPESEDVLKTALRAIEEGRI